MRYNDIIVVDQLKAEVTSTADNSLPASCPSNSTVLVTRSKSNDMVLLASNAAHDFVHTDGNLIDVHSRVTDEISVDIIDFDTSSTSSNVQDHILQDGFRVRKEIISCPTYTGEFQMLFVLPYQVVHITLGTTKDTKRFYIRAYTSFIGRYTLKFIHTKCSTEVQPTTKSTLDLLHDQRLYIGEGSNVDVTNFEEYPLGDGNRYYYRKQILLKHQYIIYRKRFHRTDHHGPFEFVVHNNHDEVSLDFSPLEERTIQISMEI
jgi:hypothetical protein